MTKIAVWGPLVAVAGTVATPDAASAQWGWGGYGYSGPVYHAPSMHYDSVYHAVPHWTPWRGWHSHGHYDVVPHYTPGHYDRAHGSHIHGNPYYHHR